MRALSALSLVLIACGAESTADVDADEMTACSVRVKPAALQLGVVEPGVTSERDVVLTNIGEGACTLVAVSADSAAITFDAPPLPHELAPHATVLIRVRATFDAPGFAEGMIAFAWAHGETSSARVTAVAAAAPLWIGPERIDVETLVGCTKWRGIDLENTTPFDVHLRSTLDAAPEFSLPSNGEVTIEPGARFTHNLYFRPGSVGNSSGSLELEWDHGAMTIPLAGHSSAGERRTEVFHTLGLPKVDLLFVIDNGPSMIEEQASVSASLDELLANYAELDIDFHIGFTTADTSTGAAAGRIAPSFVPDTSGSTLSRGLRAAWLAATSPLRETDNATFFREGAFLSVVIISDNDDASPGPVDRYIFPLSNASISVVTRESSTRYRAAARAGGGIWADIVDNNWVQTFLNIGETDPIHHQSRFFLERRARPESIEVRVDGVVISAVAANGEQHWVYDPPTNSINFTPVAVPPFDVDVEISYDDVSSCG